MGFILDAAVIGFAKIVEVPIFGWQRANTVRPYIICILCPLPSSDPQIAA